MKIGIGLLALMLYLSSSFGLAQTQCAQVLSSPLNITEELLSRHRDQS